ncbi:MAG: thrombospondin type 3 repeat-containing protein [Verrucomicrobiota bacterium]
MTVWLAALWAICNGVPGWAQSNVATVLNGSGGEAGGGLITNVAAAAQPGGVIVSGSGPLVNQAGFLNRFLLRPTLDTDADGTPNELDADNDNDDLSDAEEISGSGFSPVTATDPNDADSDGDGLSDGSEAVAGTDPTDAGVGLHILHIAVTNRITYVAFRARGGTSEGKTYVIHSHTNIHDVTPSPTSTNATPAGGSAPWYVVTNLFISSAWSNETRRFIAIEALP